MIDRAYRPGTAALVLLLTMAGCGGGLEVNTRTLRQAERTWQQARIRDYNLEWQTSGAQNGHYRVFVRDGQVRAIYMVQPDGREIVAKPGMPRLYSVDGLFQIMAEELQEAARNDPQLGPFGQPRGTRVVLRFTPDPRLGFPREFRRDVLGTQLHLALDVLRLDPNPAGPIPPPHA